MAREPRMDPAFRYAMRVAVHRDRMRSMTFASALLYLVGYTLIGIALFVVAFHLPEPYGRALSIAVIGYIIVAIGEWVDDV